MLPGADAVKLVAERGQLMNELGLTDPGAMLAVMAERSLVEKYLVSVTDVVIANHNHPTQVVLSGTTKGIEALQATLTAAGLKSTRLDVSHAFHSPLMAGMDVKMRGVVDGARAAGAALRHRLVHHRPHVRLGRRGEGDLGAARHLAR